MYPRVGVEKKNRTGHGVIGNEIASSPVQKEIKRTEREPESSQARTEKNCEKYETLLFIFRP